MMSTSSSSSHPAFAIGDRIVDRRRPCWDKTGSSSTIVTGYDGASKLVYFVIKTNDGNSDIRGFGPSKNYERSENLQ